jgi:hypothetical protein
VGQHVESMFCLIVGPDGGQVLVSGATYELLAGRMPGGIEFRDLGAHRLKDLGRAERVFQVTGPGMAEGFGPLRSLDNPALRLPPRRQRLRGDRRRLHHGDPRSPVIRPHADSTGWLATHGLPPIRLSSSVREMPCRSPNSSSCLSSTWSGRTRDASSAASV